MAPARKKAKAEAKPTPGGGLQKFFGGPKTEGISAKVEDTPAANNSGNSGTMAAVVSPAPVAQPATDSCASAPENQSSSGALTEVQKQKIEENRRKAMERKLAKTNAKEANKNPILNAVEAPQLNTTPNISDPLKSPTPLKTLDSNSTLKRKGSNITPEKISMPDDERRRSPSSNPQNERFHTFGKESWVQYNKIYSVRLEKLRGAVSSEAKSSWCNEVPPQNFLSGIASSSSNVSGEVVVIGVTFKDMPSRDNVIEQYRDSSVATSCLPEPDVEKQPNLCSDADTAWLEDETFRIQLTLSAEHMSKFATGFVAAVRGRMTKDGKLEVNDVCLAQRLCSTPLPSLALNPAYLALISGLFVGAPEEDISARTHAVDFLLGRSDSQNGKAVQHVMVCGGVYWTDEMQNVPSGIEDADTLFSQIAQHLPVDVLPGAKDPSNLSLPQMPLHSYLFRSAAKCKQFKSVSNPYRCVLNSLEILGHSGQPIRDLMRCTSLPTPMGALTTCLDGRMLAPTVPDTLTTQPFENSDPFVIETMPQVFFSGGHDQASYEWRTSSNGTSGTLCVCVPAFHKHPSVVLVNLNDPRDVHVQNFGATPS